MKRKANVKRLSMSRKHKVAKKVKTQRVKKRRTSSFGKPNVDYKSRG